jgi:tripartite-type tricarboxylate transporter receptor subunit TctC
MGGRVHTYFAPISAGISYIQSKRLRALAVTSAKRANQLPDVPTVAEGGVPGFEFILWFGLWGPAGMPPSTLNKVWSDFNRALEDRGVREKLATLGNDTMP